MSTAVRETVLDWVKTRLGTITGGYTVLRNPIDDIRPSIPVLALFDGDEDAPEPQDSGEQPWEMTIAIAMWVRATGEDSGEAAGGALSDAIAKVYDALMDPAQWDATVRRVRPGARTAVDFIAGEEAAETIGMCASHFTIEYPTSETSAFTSSP